MLAFCFSKRSKMKKQSELESWHTSCLKLKRDGKGRPFGRRALGSRSSSKKGCAHASNCDKKVNCQISMRKHASQVAKKKVTSRFVFLQKINNDGHLLPLYKKKVTTRSWSCHLTWILHINTQGREQGWNYIKTEKRIRTCTHRRAAKTWWVLQQPRCKINCLWRHPLVENLNRWTTKWNSNINQIVPRHKIMVLEWSTIVSLWISTCTNNKI
jgi:hypothetical protein